MTKKLPVLSQDVTQEEWRNEYNPYNSNKLFSQVHRWEGIQRGQPIPPPTTISIDPLNLCDERCVFCNADFVMDENKGSRLDEGTMAAIPAFLESWNDGHYRVKSICVGGGGEAWLNKHTADMVKETVARGVGVGTVTNGTQMDRWNNLEALAQCTWVGVSINAGTKETYSRVHRKDEFDHVFENIRELLDYSELHRTPLTRPGFGPGLGMKFLLHPYNVHEVVTATKLAKESGFRNIHIRPVSATWFNTEEEAAAHKFTQEHITQFREQITEAMKYHDSSFEVYGVTHKFNPDFTPANDFDKCYAIFMNGVLMPPSGRNKNAGKYNWGECCDRRGDDMLNGIIDGTDLQQIREFWGSPAHWKMHDDIKVEKCPRCTFSPHNKIYENAIATNAMSYDFI